MKRSELHTLSILSYILLTTTLSCFARRPLKRKVVLPRASLATQLDSPACQESANKPPAITIWIHGSRLFPRTVFKSFFNNEAQLKLACTLGEQYHLRQVANALIEHNAQQFPAEEFYLFGWSGKISFKTRQEASHILYTQLQELSSAYKLKYKVDPSIRIITHSHGGNVALNLAREKQIADSSLSIAELILLACPVQMQTQEYIHDPLFKKVYALYSALDFIQVLDPQGLYTPGKNTPFFSRRCFPSDTKLSQVKIQINNRAITHAEFVLPKFLCHLSDILQDIQLWYQEVPTTTAHEPVRLLCIRRK